MPNKTPPKKSLDAPWMVTLVQTQLDEMAGICNELHRAQREIKFIVPLPSAASDSSHERPVSQIAIFSLSKKDE